MFTCCCSLQWRLNAYLVERYPVPCFPFPFLAIYTFRKTLRITSATNISPRIQGGLYILLLSKVYRDGRSEAKPFGTHASTGFSSHFFTENLRCTYHAYTKYLRIHQRPWCHICVCSSRFFYPSTSITLGVRANASILHTPVVTSSCGP